MDPDQAATSQYKLPKNISRREEQMTKVLTGGQRIKRKQHRISLPFAVCE